MSSVNLKNILKESKALIVDEVDNITKQQKNILKLFLKKTYYADSIQEAQSIYNLKSPDIIISELDLKNEDCLSFLENIREYNRNIPIIIFAKDLSKESLMRLIPLGVLDVVEKPVSSDKLIYILNKTSKYIFNFGTNLVDICKKVKYDYSAKSIVVNNKQVSLTTNESHFLELLLSNHGQVFSKQAIELYIWGESIVTDGAFKSLLKRVRDKIGKHYIVNNSGQGYYLLKS